MRLADTSYGRVYTHLEARFAAIEEALRAGDEAGLRLAASALDRDPVFREVAVGWFSPGACRSRACEALRERLDRLSAGGDERVRPFVESAQRGLFGSAPEWGRHGYLTVPVIEERKNDQQRLARAPGLVYLRAVPPPPGHTPSGRLIISDLTGDPQLLEPSVDYFGRIASTLMKTLYKAHTYPFDFQDQLSRYAYQLCFECRVDRGTSIGAAALGVFAIAYLESALGQRCWSLIAPPRGTVITGEIDYDGAVAPVSDLEEKIVCAITEYGPSVRVIVPAGERLPEPVESAIDLGNLFYVGDAEELLAALLSSSDGLRGLHKARQALFETLSHAQIERLRPFFLPGIDPDRIRSGLGDPTTPRAEEGGVYVRGQAWLDTIQVKIGLEPSALDNDSAGTTTEKELIEIIIDGSQPMDEQWIPSSGTRISPIAAVLYEVASRFGEERQELVCGFLSHSEFYPIGHGESAVELENWLQGIRRQWRLRHRGPFFRQAYEGSVARYAGRLKRVFLLSDSTVPDVDDLSDMLVSSFTRLRLRKVEAQGSGAKDVCLTGDDGQSLDSSVLGRFFQHGHGDLKGIVLNLGSELPFDWDPVDGELTWDGQSYAITWKEAKGLQAAMRVTFAGQCPRAIGISGTLGRDGADVAFSFKHHLLPNQVEPFRTAEQGALADADLKLWRSICDPSIACPECGKMGVHIMHENRMGITDTIALAGLRRLNGGVVLLKDGCPEWVFFRTGCMLDGISFAKLNGKLYWSQSRGHVQPVPVIGDVHTVLDRETSYYLCQV